MNPDHTQTPPLTHQSSPPPPKNAVDRVLGEINLTLSESLAEVRLSIETTFLTTVASASIVFGFGMTIAMAKKKDPDMFVKVSCESKGNMCVRLMPVLRFSTGTTIGLSSCC